MGIFDSIKDFAGSAKNAWELMLAKKKSESSSVKTPRCSSSPQAWAKAPAPAPAASPKPTSPVIDAQRGVASLKWGTVNPIPYEDYTNAVWIPVKMCGLIEVKITDPGTTITEERFKLLFLDRFQPMVEKPDGKKQENCDCHHCDRLGQASQKITSWSQILS